MKIKKLTFLINGIEVAGVMAAQPLLQLFQPLLLQSASPMVSCGKGEASCLGLGVPTRQLPVKGAEPSPVRGDAGLSQLALTRFQGAYGGGAALHLGSGSGL